MPETSDHGGTRSGASPISARAPVTLRELTAGLVWPQLLRSAGLAVQPPRLLVGLLVVLGLLAVGWLLDVVWGAAPPAELPIRFRAAPGEEPFADAFLAEVFSGVDVAARRAMELDVSKALTALVQSAYGTAWSLLGAAPVRGAVTLAAFLIVCAIGGGAIARMTAVDVGADLSMSARDGVAFALRRWRSLTAAWLAPLFVVGAIAMLLRASGWLLLSLPVLDVLGAVLYAIPLALGLLAMLLLGVFAVGHGLLIPAVAVEGTDALDAVQRAYAYVLGRPGRMLLYAAVLLAQGCVAYLVVAWIVDAGVRFTHENTTAWLSEARAAKVHGDDAAAPTLIGFWESAFRLLPPAFLVSYAFSASTVLYLLLRRVNDEQDVRDIWMPGDDAA